VSSFVTGHFCLSNLETAWCDAGYWLHEALAEPIDSIAIAKLETAVEVLVRAESTARSKRRRLTTLNTFYGLAPDDPIAQGSPVTAKQFAQAVAGERSQILHGTRSTLNSQLSSNRVGLEHFVMTVI
jgi:hypothetical protein